MMKIEWGSFLFGLVVGVMLLTAWMFFTLL
jgi:hypothetical protein